MYKACIFDLDGTLTNTLDSLTYSTNKTLEEMGLETITKDQCRSFVGDGARCLMERALRASGDTELKRIEEGMEVYSRIFGENCMYHVRPYDGVVQMLDSLKKKGIKIAVFSNKPHLQAIDVVESTFGKGYFDHIQGQSGEFPKKPDPEGLLWILDKLGVSPAEGIHRRLGCRYEDREGCRYVYSRSRMGIPDQRTSCGDRSRCNNCTC